MGMNVEGSGRDPFSGTAQAFVWRG